MFDQRFPTQLPHAYSYSYAYIQDVRCSHAALLHKAHALYNKAVQKGTFLKLITRVLRRSRRLIDLNLCHSHLVSSRYAGLQAVSLDRIVGSAGRLEDYDLDFLPTNDRSRERWVSIAMAAFELTPLPPVELVQVDGYYFVRDGHHRISVARARRQEMIDAEVTEWQLDPKFQFDQSPQRKRSSCLLAYLG